MDKIALAKNIGARITQAREARGWSQSDLAEKIDVSRGAVGQWETGDTAPGTINLICTAIETGVSVEWLATDRGPREPTMLDLPLPRGIKNVPLISWVSAGRLADAESQIPVEDAKHIAASDLGRGDFFALKVEGDSMDVWSPDGSIIIVNRADRTLVAGRPYIFAVRGETTYKIWRPEPASLEPNSWNRAHRPIYIRRKSDFDVVGRVRRSILDL